jgi:hypothetical protein
MPLLTTQPQVGEPALVQLADGRILYWNGQEWEKRRYAPIWGRIIAFVIEFNVMFFVLLASFAGIVSAVGGSTLSEDNAFSIALLATLPALFIYFTVSFTLGRSFAQLLLNYQVIEVATGKPPTIGKAALRVVVLMLVIVPFGWIVLAATSFSDAASRALQDKAAKTIVLAPRKRR